VCACPFADSFADDPHPRVSATLRSTLQRFDDFPRPPLAPHHLRRTCDGCAHGRRRSSRLKAWTGDGHTLSPAGQTPAKASVSVRSIKSTFVMQMIGRIRAPLRRKSTAVDQVRLQVRLGRTMTISICSDVGRGSQLPARSCGYDHVRLRLGSSPRSRRGCGRRFVAARRPSGGLPSPGFWGSGETAGQGSVVRRPLRPPQLNAWELRTRRGDNWRRVCNGPRRRPS